MYKVGFTAGCGGHSAAPPGSQAPVNAGIRTAQDAVSSVFSRRSQTDFEVFPRTIGIAEGYVLVGGPTPSKLPARFETSAEAVGEGAYQVDFTRRWDLNGNTVQTAWTFKVYQNGTISGPVKSGDELPMTK
jgi:hypothetical protein